MSAGQLIGEDDAKRFVNRARRREIKAGFAADDFEAISERMSALEEERRRRIAGEMTPCADGFWEPERGKS